MRLFVDQIMAAELAMVPDAVFIPLGKVVSKVLRQAAGKGEVQPDQCLFDFPHPSGGNGHRLRLYAEHRQKLADQVANWR